MYYFKTIRAIARIQPLLNNKEILHSTLLKQQTSIKYRKVIETNVIN